MTRTPRKKRAAAWLGGLVLLAVAPTGCAALRRNEAIDTERLLAAAGFQMRLADTPEKLDAIRAMPQRRLIPQNREGKPYFSYADALACKCLYLGSEAAYQRYEKLAVEQQIAQQKLAAAQASEDAALDWELWGPWYYPWY